jgi:transposase
MRVAPKIILSGEQRAQLDAFARSRSLPLRLVQRAHIVLLSADGEQDQEIAEKLNITRQTAGRWRKRFLRLGIPGIQKDAPRPGRTKKVSDSKTKMIVRKTTQESPDNATHWSTRTMAAAVSLSPSTISRIWKTHGLKPHRIKTFKLSNDKHFIEKLNDVVGLYLSPPEHAIVLSCDEKSQIQALDRTQPGLPLKKGRCGTMTHDYKRNGTTTLFAALNTLNGKVIGTCMQRHRHQEWIKFLRLIDQCTPPDKHVHLIADNYSTHKHPKVKAWLARHRRFTVHFTPTSASWLNMVERFFRDLTDKRIRRDAFSSVKTLITAIEDYIAKHNDQPKPFIWTAQASDILEKVTRARKRLNKLQSV